MLTRAAPVGTIAPSGHRVDALRLIHPPPSAALPKYGFTIVKYRSARYVAPDGKPVVGPASLSTTKAIVTLLSGKWYASESRIVVDDA